MLNSVAKPYLIKYGILFLNAIFAINDIQKMP